MRGFRVKIAGQVFAVHIAVIGLIIILPIMRSCFKPVPKKEMVTFIDFAPPPAPVQLQPVEQLPDPTPETLPTPTPTPEPLPIPEKPKPKPKPKPKVKPKPKPKAPPKKPKWKPMNPKQIKIGRRVSPSKPTVSDAEIRKAFSGIASSKPSRSSSQFNTYLGQVRNLFLQRWNPPASATAASGSTVVRMYINKKTGQILKKVKTKGSGDPVFDRTVMTTVKGVSVLPKPPTDYPFDYVEVVFSLEN